MEILCNIRGNKMSVMTFEEKAKSDMECLYRVLLMLKKYKCDEKSIMIVQGIIEAIKITSGVGK